MLKADVTKESIKLQTSGSLSEVCADISHIITDIYCSLLKRDKDMAATFRFGITTALVMPGSPIWSENKESTGTSVVIVTKNGGGKDE